MKVNQKKSKNDILLCAQKIGRGEKFMDEKAFKQYAQNITVLLYIF